MNSAVQRMHAGLRLVTVGVTLVLSASCGHHNPISPPPPPDLSMQCPADAQVMSPEGQPTPVTYPAPTITTGTAPYSVTCTPPSGSQLGPGTYMVTCTASDAASKTASCGFSVRVFVPAKVKYTKYVGFGDSLTEGKTSFGPIVLVDFAPDSYTYKLQKLMADRYGAQTIAVINDAVGGETAEGGLDRLPGSLDRNQPEVLLLMEGTNDIAFGPSAIPTAAYALDQMVRSTLGRGIQVLLASVPPQKPGSRTSADSIALVPKLNKEIQAVAVKDGVPFVDVYGALVDHPELIGSDGLHLTSAGYDVLAQTFFDVIKAQYETRAPGGR